MRSEGSVSRTWLSASSSQEPKQNGSSGLLTTREAAEVLNVSEAAIWDMKARGELHKVGTRRWWHLYQRSEVEALAEKRRLQREKLAERKRKWRVRT